MWNRLKQQLWSWRGVLVTVPSVTIAVIGLRSLGWLQPPEFPALDQFFLLRPREAIDPRLVIVTIDEADIQQQGRWPMTDAVLANLLQLIKNQRPAAIGLDLYRDLPVEPGQRQLLQVFQTTPNLIGVQKVVSSRDSAPVAPPGQLKQQDQVGANDLILDSDGKIRRMPLYLSDAQGQPVFSFGFELAARYLKTRNIQPELLDNGVIKLGVATFPPLQANEGAYVHASAAGYQIMLNYRGSIAQFQTIRMTDVLAGRVPPDLMRDRIVLIGSIAESLKDLFYTPYSSSLATPSRTPGIVIHANLISQILSSVLDGRPRLHTWSEPLEWLWILLWATIGATLSWQQRYLKRPWNLLSLVSVVSAAGLLVGLCFVAFLQSQWIPVVPPVLALIGSAFAITGYVARSAADMRRTFGRYLTDEVVASLLETPSGLNLGGERRQVTIMVTDLRGFSAISERLPPEQVVTILNLYLTVMSDIITAYHGTINEIMGDGIFVLFGAPICRTDDSQRAIACAIALQTAMADVNQQNRTLGFPSLEMGIGINTGEVVVGNIGSQKRAKYTVIGSHANLAARVESYTVGGQILISEHTFEAAGDRVQISGQMQVEPKGIREPIMLYQVSGMRGKYGITLPAITEAFVPLSQPLPVRYTVLEGKHSVGTVFAGQLVQLSCTSAELRSTHSLVPLSNLKLTLLPLDDRPEITDLYAKVLNQPVLEQPVIEQPVIKQPVSAPPAASSLEPAAIEETSVHIRFTSLLPEVAALFAAIVNGENRRTQDEI